MAVSPVPSPTAEATPTTAPAVALAPAPTPPPTPVPTPRPTLAAPPAANVPVLAGDAGGLANQLIASERAVRDAGISGEALLWNGHLQQLVYRKLVDVPELRDPVFALIPADLRYAADFNLAAGAELRSMHSVLKSTLPLWRIVDPAPIDELMGYYKAAEAEFGVHWSYLASIHLIETRMGRIRGLSSAGAQGPMQFIPSTWAVYGEGDINSNKDSIRAAARYLKASGYHTNLDLAIWRYNHSYKYVRAVKHYAEVMQTDPNAYRGYHQWQVYYLTSFGDILLPVGYVNGS
jgi:transglycosylase-like protein with SLT domain